MLERLMQEEKNPNMGPRSFSTVYLITVQISTFSTQHLVSFWLLMSLLLSLILLPRLIAFEMQEA